MLAWLNSLQPWVAALGSLVSLAVALVALFANVGKPLLVAYRRNHRTKRRSRVEAKLQDAVLQLRAYRTLAADQGGLEFDPSYREAIALGKERRMLVTNWDNGRLYARLARRTDHPDHFA